LNPKVKTAGIFIAGLAIGYVISVFRGKGKGSSEMPFELPPPTEPTHIDYMPAYNNYPLFMPNPSINPIWQNLKPYPVRFDYPYPPPEIGGSIGNKVNLPAYQGHLARVHLSSEE
jgi:hypothetical protein